MKLALRYCQHCRSKALTPKSRRKPGMRPGYVYRRNHDLCGRCFREAAAGATRLWSLRRCATRRGPLRATRVGPIESAPLVDAA